MGGFSSTSSQIPESKTLENEIPPRVSDPANGNESRIKSTEEVSDQLKVQNNDEDADGQADEEEEECGFCLFMKEGGCKESFISWEKCIEDAEKNKEDIVEKCFEVTGLLKQCMLAHADYYAPILEAEKVAEEEAVKELEREAASKDSEQQPAASDK